MSDSATAWTVDRQAPLSMGFSRPEYWSGLPCPPPGGLPDPEMEPESSALAGRFFTTDLPGKHLFSELRHDKSTCFRKYPSAFLFNSMRITRSFI